MVFIFNIQWQERLNVEFSSIHPNVGVLPESVTGDPNETIDHFKVA